MNLSTSALSNLHNIRVLVIGDVMLDQYVFGSAIKLSNEAPVPIISKSKVENRLGGVGNVVNNLAALGVHVELCGYVGKDSDGDFIKQLFKCSNIGTTCLWSAPSTTTKFRVIANNQQIVRIDNDSICDASEDLIKTTVNMIKSVDGVIISDYNKGIVTRDMATQVIEEAIKLKIPVFVDPKKKNFHVYSKCTVITPNKSEAEIALGMELDEDNYKMACERILYESDCGAVLITLGEHGMVLYEKGYDELFCIPAIAKDVRDVTGAGDTVIAVLAACKIAGNDLRTSAAIANIAASIAVSKLGTSIVTMEELMSTMEMMRRRNYRPYILS